MKIRKPIIILTSLLLLAGVVGFSLNNYFVEGDNTASTEQGMVAAEEGEGTMPGRPAGAMEDGEGRALPEGAEEGAPMGGQEEREMLDTAAAAEELGITEDELIAALGTSEQGPPDFAEVAETLGITEEELLSVME